jgi:hypothetical protein
MDSSCSFIQVLLKKEIKNSNTHLVTFRQQIYCFFTLQEFFYRICQLCCNFLKEINFILYFIFNVHCQMCQLNVCLYIFSVASSSHHAVPTSVTRWNTDDLKRVLSSLKLKDPSIFGL